MSYIGRQLNNLSDRVKLDAITASATATYNLLLNTVAYVPSSAESLTVSLNGVIQAPQSSYTVSGSQITFASALTSSDSIDFILAERSITLQTPSAGSVGTSQLASSAVTTAKINADAVDGTKIADDSISDEHLDITAITGQTEKTSLADADKFLISDSAASGALKYVQKSNLPSGGLIHLHKLTMSSTSTASFNAGDNSGAVLYDGTYKYLMWTWTFNTSSDTHVRFQFSTNGGSSYACTMHAASRVLAERDVGASTQNTFGSSAGTDTDTVSNATDFQPMTWYQTSDNAFQFHGKCELWNPQTSYPHFSVNAFYRSSGANIVNTFTHGMLSDADVDGFQIKPDAGNFASGEINMYGFVRS